MVSATVQPVLYLLAGVNSAAKGQCVYLKREKWLALRTSPNAATPGSPWSPLLRSIEQLREKRRREATARKQKGT